MKNSLVKDEKKRGEVIYEVDGQNVTLSPDIIKNFLVNGTGNITNQEINYFIQLCKGRKLNPHLKEAYLIKFGNSPATMVVSKDVLERRAIKHPAYNGKKVGIYVKNESGLERRDNNILMQGEILVGAWCEVYRKDWEFPVVSSVNFEEYVGKKNDGTVNAQWSNKPVTMITKVAKAQALREAFIEELAGMYEEGEMVSDEPQYNNYEEKENVVDTKINDKEIEEAELVEPSEPTENNEIKDIFTGR